MTEATLFDSPANGDSSRSLFDALLRAESGPDVISVLQASGHWDDPDAWAVLGEVENNFSVASNQQTDATSALVEKVINAIDAELMAGAFVAGVDPEGPDAPQSMADAVNRFFGVPEGRLGDLTTRELTSLAQNIHVVATGPKESPCYLVVDQGEGQTPEAFSRTFLSVLRSNKLRIPFVQGKHNSGGLGVLQFCRQPNLQLIASRRHPAAPHNPDDSTADLWGFTVVRRQAPSDTRPNSMYVYLAPGNQVPRFAAADGVPVLPLASGSTRPTPYAVGIKHGTVVKVYDYRWRAKSMATTEARFEFEKFLHAPCLPFRVTETRDYRANYYSTTVSGIWAAITAEEDTSVEDRKVETGYPAPATLRMEGIGSLSYQIVVFRKEVDTRRIPHGVFFTVNGQVHGSLPADFVTRRLKFDYLRSHLFVSVDCSNMETEALEDFFMASRDRLRRNELYDRLVRTLEEQLREHPGLKELNAARRAAQLASTLDRQEDVLATLEGILRSVPALRSLFGLGDRLISRVGPAEVEEYTGLRFPTYFRLRGSTHESVCRQVPVNRSCNVEFETDVANDYFGRTESPGRMTVQPDVRQYGRLWNGIYLARLTPPEGSHPGDRLVVKIEVTDPDRESQGRLPFATEVEITVGEPDTTVRPPGGQRSPRRPADGRSEAPRLALPEVHEVRREAWEESDPPFTDSEVLRAQHSGSGDGYDFFLNIDNKYLISELRSARSQDHDLVRYQFKWGVTLCAMGLLRYVKDHSEGNGTGGNGDVEDAVDEIELVNATIGGVAMVIIPIIRNLFRGPDLA